MGTGRRSSKSMDEPPMAAPGYFRRGSTVSVRLSRCLMPMVCRLAAPALLNCKHACCRESFPPTKVCDTRPQLPPMHGREPATYATSPPFEPRSSRARSPRFRLKAPRRRTFETVATDSKARSRLRIPAIKPSVHWHRASTSPTVAERQLRRPMLSSKQSTAPKNAEWAAYLPLPTRESCSLAERN